MVFVIIIFYTFDTFTNTYIVLKDDHHTRLLREAGYCEKTGYGLHKSLIEKFSNINENISSLNYNGHPSSEGYFYNYKKKSLNNYLLLVGADEIKLDFFLKKNYRLIYSSNNCYLLSK